MEAIKSSVYLKRIGAIPSKCSYEFGSKNLYDATDRINDIENSIDNQKGILTDVLSEKIKLVESDDDRKILINLKRDIHNLRGKFIKTIEKNQELLKECNLLEKCNEFIDSYNELIKERQELEELYEEETLNERIHMHDTYEKYSEVLNKALKFIHPTILDKSKGYLNTPVEKHNANLRKFDNTLAKILTRASHKTSPFSTLTHVGAGFLEDNQITVKENEYHTITRFNLAYALRVFERLLSYESIYINLNYKLSDTLVLLRGKFYWTVLTDEPEKRKKVYKSVDKLVTVKATNTLEKLYDEFKKKDKFHYRDILNFLIKCDYTKEKAESLIKNLIERQFFSPTIFLDQNSDYIIEDCIEKIEKVFISNDNDSICHVLKLMKEINEEIKKFDSLSAKEQYISFKKIDKTFGKVVEILDLEGIDSKQILYQDSLLNNIESLNEKQWKNTFESFELFQKISKIFDVAFRFQMLLGKEFYERFGTEKVNVNEKEHIILDTLLTKLIENTGLWDDQFKISYKDYGIKEISELDEIKRDFIMELIELSKHSNGNIININNEIIMKYIDRIPKNAKEKSQSNSFFVQKISEDNNVVLNNFYAGSLIFFLRFLRNLEDVREDSRVKEYIKKTIEDRNIADIHLMYGFNANMRPSITKKAVTLPNNRVINNEDKKFEKIVDWKNVELQYSKDSKKIKILDNDEEVKMQFLGTLVTTLLPSIPAMLHLLNFNVVFLKDIGYSLVYDFMENNKEFEIKEFPRIVFNDNLVVARRRWLVNTKVFEDIIDVEKLELVKNMTKWINKNYIPKRVFVSKFFYGNEGIDMADDNTDKPQYIDFTSTTLLNIFKKTVQNTKYIIIEEVLPDLESLGKSNENVEEYIFELTNLGE